MPLNLRPAGVAAGIAALVALAGCGTPSSAQAAGKSASVTFSLRTVSHLRSVTVSASASARQFRHCVSGSSAHNTASTGGSLGFPNGLCWVGQEGPGGSGSYPITVTNTGVATNIDVSASNAMPSDGGTSWGLCNRGPSPAVGCTGKGGRLPGANQYLLQNFSPAGRNPGGLTATPQCDPVFGTGRPCWIVQGASQTEGLELTGPTLSHDLSTRWRITITWLPAPAS